ncbi:hda-10 [Pristionchus pacificus]|uniref:Histone deacetylase n=1 Tax=Pristionchus pacificus TaxID=54126 RepID=A0A2A6B6V7_PRIPA|nr:hda-10 [Pristionchus pacificus]|eukprot:PDM61612.1 hda-10 [Pristionchus pacificus]
MFFVSDEKMLDHCIRWDSYHIESPDRMTVILDRLKSCDLLDNANILPSRSASVEEIEIVHTRDYIDQIKTICTKSIDEIEDYCKTVEDVYMNENTYDLALLSAGCSIDATLSAFKEKSSSFAVVRPPGHHAFPSVPCGFCWFNNVAIAAKHARSSGAQRILIVDWDVHAGQGTQECIQGDNGIKLISIHRFEHGNFWPNLEQSSVDHKFPNTINVPLNSIGEDDSSFISIFHLVVLPTLIDYQPDLIIVSCGFDAAIGDPEGEMKVSPHGYGRMTRLLMNTGIPISLILEGGYFLPSISRDAEFVVRALQGETFPILPTTPFSSTLNETLRRVISSSSPSTLQSIKYLLEKSGKTREPNTTSPEYKGSRIVPDQYPTREIYQEKTPEEHARFVIELEDVMKRYEEEGTKGSKIKLTISEESQFSIKETVEGEIEIFTSSSLHPLVHSTIISYLNPETSFSPSFFTSPSTQQLDIFFEVILSLSSHSSFSHIPLIRILTQ